MNFADEKLVCLDVVCPNLKKKKKIALSSFPLKQRKPLCTHLQKKNLPRKKCNTDLATGLSKRAQNHLCIKSRQELCNALLNFWTATAWSAVN